MSRCTLLSLTLILLTGYSSPPLSTSNQALRAEDASACQRLVGHVLPATAPYLAGNSVILSIATFARRSLRQETRRLKCQ